MNTNVKSASKKSTTAKKSSTKKSSKKAAATKKPVASIKRHAAASTRNFIDQQMVIVKKVDSNPRREGTEGYKSFSKIKSGMTVEQFVTKGGRLRDLHWDIDHKYVELKKATSKIAA